MNWHVKNNKGEIIRNARISVIRNFISLTKVFTRSPFDSVLLNQIKSMKIFGRYDEDKAKEDAIFALANGKKEVFSFKKIKPSLVFFNRDGQSLSIISNNDKKEKEYKDLQALWNSQNINQNILYDLIDYKNLKHEQYLEQIKNLFSLDKMNIEDLKGLCESLGNYIFVCDNFIKMVRILLNIESKIPVILIGETGVGKTKLLEMLATLYGKGKCRWKKLQIHAGITDEKIIAFIDEINEEIEKKGEKNELIWIFFDEMNTCNSLGLITEIMCNHTYLGKKINDNFIFLGAFNPYRIKEKQMRESGLVYYNLIDKNKLNNLVYTVNPLPHSLLNFAFDFDSLKAEDEQKYIENSIISILQNLLQKGLIKINNNNYKEINDIYSETVISIVICHNYIREKYDESSVSLRELRRFGIFFEYFIKYFIDIKSSYKRMKNSLNMTLYLCYYLRLNENKYRLELTKSLNDYFYKNNSFLKVPNQEITKITEEMKIEKSRGIALNKALKENLFSIFVSLMNKVPLIIIGKPGTSKSLSFQILFNTMKGEHSDSKFFKDKGKLYRYYYQGSESSTSEGIEKIFTKAMKAKENNKNKNIISLVFFDEMGLAERSSNNPLKIMHHLLEKDEENSIPFLGISNWRLDASKINRTLSLTITDYSIEDLQDTALSIAEALDSHLSEQYKEFFHILARTYHKYMIFNQNSIKENKDFHGNRDFYNLIKNAMNDLINKVNIFKEKFKKNEEKLLARIAITSLERNFGGLENSTEKIKEIFKEEYGHQYNLESNPKSNFSILNIIEKNIVDSNSRYLMVISEGNDGSDIIKFLLKNSENIKRDYIELVGSKYKSDIKSGRYSEEILNKIKYIMETNTILILKDLDMIYASLYDLFNQNFTSMGDKKYARIAFEYAKLSSEVNKDFRVIIIVDKNKINNLKLDPPFLNRFEKHIVNFRMLLSEKDIEIAENVNQYLHLVSSFNNNQELKLDLQKLLLNCRKHDIEGLIFKIKKEKKLNENSPEYKINLIKEIFKKIVPIFCQDIIASIISSNMDEQYHYINEIVKNIYKNSRFNNFESFFKNIQSKKNIIYTFSKITENFINEDNPLGNKYGAYNKKSIKILMIESIRCENDLAFLLKTFNKSLNKKILILKFSENDLNKLNSINHVIENFEKENRKQNDKLIIFIIHRQRTKISEKKAINHDLISLINDDYNQIFIGNLLGEQNLDIFKIVLNENLLGKEFIKESNFIDNNIYSILNYIKFNIINETNDFNIKNCIKIISEKIINNKHIKDLFLQNIEKQGESKRGIIKEVFTSDINEVNDVDFFEVINSKLKNYFSFYLLNIVYYTFKQNILIPILNNNEFEFFMKNEFFNELINKEFEKIKFNFEPRIRLNINANEITIYNGLLLPKSKLYIDKFLNYINEQVIHRYITNEQLLRKNYIKEEKIREVINSYNNELDRLQDNSKNELNKPEYQFFKRIFFQDNNYIKELLLKDYLNYFIDKYLEKRQINLDINGSIIKILLIIIEVKLSQNNLLNYKFKYTIDEFIKIILYIEGYKDDIKNIFNILIDIQKYKDKFEECIIAILDEKIIKYEISERNKEYTKIVNIPLYNILESLIRSILLFSKDLIKINKNKFYEFFGYFKSFEAILQKINRKYYLFSKEIFNLRYIIKIEEAYKYNYEQFYNNYEIIMDNLLQQSIYIYNNNYNNLYKIILKLNEIFEKTFKDKNEEYINLLFFIFRQQNKIIYNEETKIKLIEDFFKNPLLIRKSKIFLSETLKDLKPEILNENSKKKEKDELLVKNFINLNNNKKLIKYKELFAIYNNIKSNEFNELLLYTFETQCQSYFMNILKNNDNKYTERTCKEMLLKVSFEYLKKAIQYLYEQININDNNLLKLLSIAYIKTYCYYYVEINYKYFDICNFDEINILFNDENEKNKLIRNMRNIYIWRIYYKKFENFEKFQNYDFEKKNIPIYKELINLLNSEKKKKNINYIFNQSFITIKSLENYQKISPQIHLFLEQNENTINFNFDDINQNFDFFYSILVNKILSYLYGNNKQFYVDKLKKIYELTKNKINLGEEGQKLYLYIMNEDLFEKEIIKKISEVPLNQEEFEILLYSFRFILNIQINNNNSFYNNLIKKNSFQFINNNFMPGTFALLNEFIKSYNDLVEKFQNRQKLGYYICINCGYLYEVGECTFPTVEGRCPNGHIIGGINHICSKKDIRVFHDMNELNNYKNNNDSNNFESKTLEEYKRDYVDKFLDKKAKGIMKDYRYNDFEKKYNVRNLNIITYRVLNFVLYSYLLGSFILDNLSFQEMRTFLIENLFPHSLFGVIKRGWELLNISLKEIGIENAQIFMNMIFDKLISLMINVESIDTQEKFDRYEMSVNQYILEIISNKNKIRQINEEYYKLNNELLSFNPQSITEIIKSNFEPSIYSQNEFPDIQYYTFSKIQDFDSFIKKFNSSEENKNKYSLINILINKDEEILKNSINMANLININKLSNLLINFYSYKISREDAKSKKLKNELTFIIDSYNEINNEQINEKDFIKEYIDPFIASWDKIKNKSVQYKCRTLKPLDLDIEKTVYYFLIDDGDKEGGMALASAYQHFIEWQNIFINQIISKNKMSGILNSYISQLEQEINIQDASPEEIINIDDGIYKILNELISNSSMRNIFGSEKNKINYKNYNDIEYNYDYIEEELAKLILPGLKKFKNENIKFVTYLYEGFRGGNTSLLIDYKNKYIQRELSEEEKNSINKIIENNNNSKFYKEIFASLQILMNQIVKENYNEKYLINKIINNLPKYFILKVELKELFKSKSYEEENNKNFTVDSLVSIFEYFEDLCWNEIKKNVLPDYQLELSEKLKNNILLYFNENNKKDKTIINKNNFTLALRKLISRSIAGTRQEVDIKYDAQLKLYIIREDLWNKDILDKNLFYEEIDKICKPEIIIGHSWNLYNILEGDKEKNVEMFLKKKKEIIEDEDKEFEMKKDSNQNRMNSLNRIIAEKEEEESEEEEHILTEDEDSDDKDQYF